MRDTWIEIWNSQQGDLNQLNRLLILLKLFKMNSISVNATAEELSQYLYRYGRFKKKV